MKRQLIRALSLPLLLTALIRPSFSDDSCPSGVCGFRPSTKTSQLTQSVSQPPSDITPRPEPWSYGTSTPQLIQPDIRQVPGYQEPIQNTLQPTPDYNIQFPTQQPQPLTQEQVGEYTHRVITGINFPAFEWLRIETVERNQWWDVLDIVPNKEVAVHTHNTRFQPDGGMGHIDTISELQNFAYHTGSQFNPDNPVNPSNFERHCGALAIPPKYVMMVEGQEAYTQVTTDFDRMVAIGTKGLEVIPYTSANGNKSYLGSAEIMRNHKTSGSSCAGGNCK